MKNNAYLPRNRGFSLIEMAVVLVIVGLMMSALTMPLMAQMDQNNYRETEEALAEWREGLIGYAASNGYLPCPDKNGDGMEDRPAAGGECDVMEGNVPWVDLGLKKMDNWNNIFRYRVTPGFARIGLSLNTIGTLNVRDTNNNDLARNVPAVLVSKGKNGNGSGISELKNSDNNDEFVSDTPSTDEGNEFDDIVSWVPTTLLFNRMVSAGKLP